MTIEQAARHINKAQYIIFTSGAGLGVDSGLPDFRGKGFWRAYPPIARLGLKFEQVSTPRWFRDDPAFAWGFFAHRYFLYKQAVPHDGYRVIKRIADQTSGNYFVFTSNVDGHFLRANIPEEKLIEYHGSLQYLQFVDDHGDMSVFPVTNQLDGIEVDHETFKVKSQQMLPTIKGELLRPNVLMFNDDGFVPTRWEVQDAQMGAFKKKLLSASIDDQLVVIEMGAGVHVETVRKTSEKICRTFPGNSTLIRINPRDLDGPASNETFTYIPIADGAKNALQQIENELEQIHYFQEK